MRRHQFSDLLQIPPPALTERHPDRAAHLTADDEVERAIAIKIGEIDNRSVTQLVQVHRGGVSPGHTEPATRGQTRPVGTAAVDVEVDRAPVIGVDEVAQPVLIYVR